jgi:uncharacterized membrane protein YsdA (DUF1294 family)
MDKLKFILMILFLIYNLFVFILYGIDKGLSKTKRQRISEKTLVLTALFGGLGAFSAMLVFRHKTRKPKFYLSVPLFFLISVFEILILLKH